MCPLSIVRLPSTGGTAATGGWDTSELALELLFGILLRNRDRISALWPPVYDHLQVRGLARHSLAHYVLPSLHTTAAAATVRWLEHQPWRI